MHPQNTPQSCGQFEPREKLPFSMEKYFQSALPNGDAFLVLSLKHGGYYLFIYSQTECCPSVSHRNGESF